MRTLIAVVAATAVLALPGCNEREEVDLAFRPAVGQAIGYVVDVDSRTVTVLDGPPDQVEETISLRADQEVIGERDGTLQLEISMAAEGQRARRFDVRLDTERGTATVHSVEGLPVEVLGELGPSRLVLLATGLLPGDSLHPGERWDIRRTLELTEGEERLTGTGRLIGLRVEDGTALARVEAQTRLPVERDLRTPQGRVVVDGVEFTRAEIDYRVADGTVASARSVTTGMFTLAVSPPGGTQTAPLAGTLEVRVESRTTRVPAGGAALSRAST
ncbi:MAG TPA: hypothetical protein VM618_09665 [Acidimicrobiia bacterium]|nr:hypothetical protein [Acidimicrobiia bacterium]